MQPPRAAHCLISKARPVAQNQPQLCWLPSGQAPVAQLGGSQHLQSGLSQRIADQGSIHCTHSSSLFWKKVSRSLLPESLLHERTGLRLARCFHPDVVRGKG